MSDPIIIPCLRPLPIEHGIEFPTWCAAKLGEAWNLCPPGQGISEDERFVFNLKLSLRR
jgi:hypothetical protein